MKLSKKEEVFQGDVLTRFELYKSLFLTLPFQRVKDTGTILPFFTPRKVMRLLTIRKSR